MMAPDCILCSERIETLESVRIHPGWAHRECALRSVLGGIGHHEDHAHWCNIMHDPDGGRTYRQSAIEVARLWGLGEIAAGEFDG